MSKWEEQERLGVQKMENIVQTNELLLQAKEVITEWDLYSIGELF